MSFIKRVNLSKMRFTENIINRKIREMSSKIGVPIIINQSLRALTKYRGEDNLGYKRIKSRQDRLISFLLLLKHLYKVKKENDVKYKSKKTIKILITKNNNIHFLYAKLE